MSLSKYYLPVVKLHNINMCFLHKIVQSQWFLESPGVDTISTQDTCVMRILLIVCV